jgi:uncharacterized protein
MEWYNEPAAWREHDGVIEVTSAPRTDFWRKTHYGFIRDNGHFYHRTVEGDFVARVTIRGDYAAQYDQAGVMVRVDEGTWLKCGIELVDGVQHAGAVVTRDFSDWSVVALPENPPACRLRLTRQGDTVDIEYALDGGRFARLRMAYLPPVASVQVGLMCASPEGSGFTSRFEGFSLEPLQDAHA